MLVRSVQKANSEWKHSPFQLSAAEHEEELDALQIATSGKSKETFPSIYTDTHTYSLQGWVRKVGDRKVWMSDGRWLGQWHHQLGSLKMAVQWRLWLTRLDIMGYSFCLSQWRMWKCVHSPENAAVSHAVSVRVWSETGILNIFKVEMQKCESGVIHLDQNTWKCCSFTGSQTKSGSLSLEADRQLHIGK